MPIHRSSCVALAGALLAGVTPLPSRPGAAPKVEVDHLILGINNLDRGIEEFTRVTGVTPERGGRHPGRGTENALVSLGGGQYLEILAPVTADSAIEASRFTRLTPAGWALHSSDLPGTIEQLKAAAFTVAGPIPGSRRRTDGIVLDWQTANVTGAGLELAPFFIAWSATSTHPSKSSPSGCTLVALELREPEPKVLERFFGTIGFPATLRAGSPRGMQLTLECPKGRVSFGT